jgi:hypothetical protein
MAFSVAAGDGRVRAAAGLISAAIMATAAIAPESAPVFCLMVIAPWKDEDHRLNGFPELPDFSTDRLGQPADRPPAFPVKRRNELQSPPYEADLRRKTLTSH